MGRVGLGSRLTRQASETRLEADALNWSNTSTGHFSLADAAVRSRIPRPRCRPPGEIRTMSEQPEPLRRISWKDLFPWLLLFRTFSLSIGGSTLFLALLAVTVIPASWRFGALLFLSEEDRLEHALIVAPLERFPGQAAALTVLQERDLGSASVGEQGKPRTVLVADSGRPDARMLEAVELAGATLALLVQPEASVPVRAFVAFGAVATLLVYALAGGAVTRIAVLRLGREERAGLLGAVTHAWKRWPAYTLAPVYPLVAVLVIFLCAAGLGLMMRLGVTAALAVLMWPFALLGGAIGAILLAGLAGGGSLMWGATASEPDGDVFESISRAYSYVFGRPLNLAAYAILAAAIGSLGWLLVSLLCQLTAGIPMRGAAWGAAGAGVFGEEPSGLSWLAYSLMNFGNNTVAAVRRAFEFSFFWTAVGAIYLLMRRDVDNTELDEVYHEDSGQKHMTPALKIDASGVPQVEEAEVVAEVDDKPDEQPGAGP